MTSAAVSRMAVVVGGALGQPDALLTRLGFAGVEHVASVDAAVDLVRAKPVDLVLVPVDRESEASLALLDGEARKSGKTFVIGTAPRMDSDLILRAMRAGVNEFVVRPAQEADLSAAIARLTRRVTPSSRGQVIAVHSAKGGLGCTTIAVNLATALAAADTRKRVALVDLVLADGDIRLFLGNVGNYNVMDLAAKLDHADEELVQSMLTTSHGVAVLPSPENAELEDRIDADTTERLLQRLRAHFDFVIVDVEHHMSPRTLATLDAADRVLLVTQLSVVALRSAQRTLAVFRELGYPDEKTAVVLNRYVRGDLLGRRDAAKVLARDVFHSLPNDFEHANTALTKGMPISEIAGDSKLAGEFVDLAFRMSGSADVRELPVKADNDSGIKRLFKRSKRA